jgi:fused signal recognition particle receptor
MEISTELIVTLSIVFTVIGVGSSVVYYIARYYFRTDHTDKELWTKKPLEVGIEDQKNLDGLKSQDLERALDVNEVSTTAQLPSRLQPQPRPQPQPKAVDLSTAMAKTKDGLWGRIASVVLGKKVDQGLRGDLEEILITADMGVQTTDRLLESVLEKAGRDDLSNAESLRSLLKTEVCDIFSNQRATTLVEDAFKRKSAGQSPTIWMVVGVNGAGKTTSIGKLAHQAVERGLKTMVVAGDTFRAAADAQLNAWAERSGSLIFRNDTTKDPAAMAFQGLEKAKADGFDLVIVDTAGRLHTQEHLMDELKKVKRVMAKVLVDSPHETLIVLDANSGQNALMQAREFNNHVGLTGVILTKMDGTSKGAIAVSVVNELNIPVLMIGVGEGVKDLRDFSVKEFVDAIL